MHATQHIAVHDAAYSPYPLPSDDDIPSLAIDHAGLPSHRTLTVPTYSKSHASLDDEIASVVLTSYRDETARRPHIAAMPAPHSSADDAAIDAPCYSLDDEPHDEQ
jgi:hypothetical protein